MKKAGSGIRNQLFLFPAPALSDCINNKQNGSNDKEYVDKSSKNIENDTNEPERDYDDANP